MNNDKLSNEIEQLIINCSFRDEKTNGELRTMNTNQIIKLVSKIRKKYEI